MESPPDTTLPKPRRWRFAQRDLQFFLVRPTDPNTRYRADTAAIRVVRPLVEDWWGLVRTPRWADRLGAADTTWTGTSWRQAEAAIAPRQPPSAIEATFTSRFRAGFD